MTTTTETRPVALAPLDQIKATIYGQQDAIAKVLPKAVPPDRFARIALMAITKSPGLLACTPGSLLRCVLEAAGLGLEPTGLLGGAWMVPYWNSKKKASEAQLILSYAGLIKLTRRSGEITAFDAHVVRRGDRFRLIRGSDPVLEHERDYAAGVETGAPPPDVRLVYAVARFRDGSWQADVMTTDEVELTRARSKAAKGGPWVTDWCEMARKTVARRLCKYLPMPDVLAWAIDADEARDRDELDVSDLAGGEEVARQESKGDRVLGRIGGAVKIPEAIPEPSASTEEGKTTEEAATIDDPEMPGRAAEVGEEPDADLDTAPEDGAPCTRAQRARIELVSKQLGMAQGEIAGGGAFVYLPARLAKQWLGPDAGDVKVDFSQLQKAGADRLIVTLEAAAERQSTSKPPREKR